MAGYETRDEATVGKLVGGIVGDLQTLVRQEMALAKAETREELEKAKQAAIASAIGAGLLVMGAILLVLFAAQGIADLFEWPTWAGYALVGGLLAVGGAVSLMTAKKRAQQIHPVPEKTVATMKENYAWLKDRTTSVPT